jgi:hypothetical protein
MVVLFVPCVLGPNAFPLPSLVQYRHFHDPNLAGGSIYGAKSRRYSLDKHTNNIWTVCNNYTKKGEGKKKKKKKGRKKNKGYRLCPDVIIMAKLMLLVCA